MNTKKTPDKNKDIADELGALGAQIDAKTYKEAVDAYAGVSKTDSEGKIMFVNDLFCDLTGYKEEELIGKNHKMIASGTHSKEFYKSMWSTLLSGQTWRGEIKNRSKNGEFYWLNMIIVPIKDSDNKTTNYISMSIDITDKKLSEEKLEDKEKVLKQVFNQSQDAIMTLEPPHWNFKHCNLATLKLFNIDSDEKLNKMGPADLSPKLQNDKTKSSEKVKNKIEQALKTGKCLFEWTHKKTTGELIECVVLLSRITENDREFIQSTVRDITNQKQLERDLREKTRELEEAQHISQLGSWRYNFGKQKRSWSRQMFNIFEINPELGSPKLDDIERLIHPEDKFLWIKSTQDCLEKGKPFLLTVRIKTPNADGGYSWVEFRGKALRDKNGKINILTGTCQNVTERALKEKQRALMLKTTNTGLWKYYPDKNNLIWDESMYKLFDVDQNSFTGAYDAWYNTLHPDSRNTAMRDFEEALNGSGNFSGTFKIITKHNKIKHIGASAIIERDNKGNPIFVTGFNWDRTKEQNAVDEMKKQMKMTQHSARLASIGELAAGVGHEINNPLAIIKAYLMILKTKLIALNIDNIEETLSRISKIDLAADRISNIVKGLRTFSRTDQAADSNFDPLEALRESYEMVREIYKKDEINFMFDSQGFGDTLLVQGNRGKFQQVIMNLLSNAKDALTDVKKKEIFLQTNISDGLITVTVTDNGQGMPEAIREKIFDPFFTTKDVHKGTGIGLSLVHRFVEEMDGTIEVESKEGKGTQFCIKLPVKKGEKMTDMEKNIQHKDNEIENNNKKYEDKKIEILLVDDEEDLRDVLSMMLTEYGLKVTTAVNGQEAMNIYKANPKRFELIISDIKMPKMDGPSFLKELRSGETDDHQKFVFMTGGTNFDFDLSKSEIAKNVDGFIYKPFTEDDIESIVKFCKDENAEELSNRAA